MNEEIAVILCGGSGTRLKPITDYYSKPLVPVRSYDNTYSFNVERIILELFYERSVSFIILVVSPEYESEYRERLISKFRYQYNITIIVLVNNRASSTNNITSFMRAIQFIDDLGDKVNTFIIDGDSYIANGSFLEFNNIINDIDNSVFFTIDKETNNEWEVIIDCKTSLAKSFKHNSSKNCLSGICYISYVDMLKIQNYLSTIDINFDDYWESHIERLLPELSFIVKKISKDSIIEYDNVFDLMKINGVQETLKLIPGITEVSDYSIGGMTNNNYLITYRNTKYIVRIPGVGSDEFTHRDAEAKIYEKLEGFSITPEVIYLGPLKLTKYLDNYSVWDPINDNRLDILQKIINKLAIIHTLSISSDENYSILNPIEEVKNYNRLRLDTEQYRRPEIKDTYYNIEQWLLKQKFNFNTVVHGDLINSNILVDNDSKEVCLIDFEYTALCDRLWDLGDILSEMSLVNDDIKNNDDDLINTAIKIQDMYNMYCTDKVSYIDIIKWCAITHYVWTAWGYARTALGDDEKDYANERLEQCIRCLSIIKEDF